jgi:hypothetical protein
MMFLSRIRKNVSVVHVGEEPFELRDGFIMDQLVIDLHV